jgi:hypothetical protein
MSHTDTNRLRQLEAVALFATVLAVGLTALLEPATAAVESNPFAAGLLDVVGWTGAGIVAIVGEAALFAGWRRLAARGYPRAALGAGAGIAVVGVADVLVNLVVLSRVGLPETARIGEYGGVTAIVAVVALLAYFRGEVRVAVEIVIYALRGVTGRLSYFHIPGTVAVAVVVALLVVSAIPFGGLVADTGTNGTVSAADVQVAYTATGNNNLAAVDTSDGSVIWENTNYGFKSVAKGINGDYIYGGTSGNELVKVNATDGTQEDWVYSGPSNTVNDVEVGPGGDAAYIGTEAGKVHKVDLSDGSKIWSKTVDSNKVLTVSADPDGSAVYSGGFNYVKKLDSSDGSNLWTNSITDTAYVSTNGDQVVVGMYGEVRGYDTNGTQIWTNTPADTSSRYRFASYSGDDSRVHMGTNNNRVYSYYVDNGTENWNYSQTGRAMEGGATGQNGQVFFSYYNGSDGKNLVELNGDTGTVANRLSPTVSPKNMDLGVTAALSGVKTNGTITDGDGSGVDAATVELRQSGSVVKSTTSASDGTYSFSSVSDGDYTVRASASGYQNASKSITVSGAPRTVDLTLFEENSYEQVLVLSDETGKFDPDDSSVITFRYTGDSVPTSGPFYDKSSWTWVETSSFNWENTTSQRLKNGEIYAFAVTDGSTRRFQPAGTLYEFVGFYGGTGDNPKYLRIRDQSETNEVVAADTDDGVTVTYEGNDTNTSLDDVDYSFPDGSGGTTYNGGADFDDPSGDYQSTVSDDLLENITDDGSSSVPEVDYNGTQSSGEILNGTTDVLPSFPGFTSSGNESSVGGFGPTGGGGGASTGQQIGGLAIIAGAGYLAYRRFGNGNLVDNIPGVGGS